MVTSVTSAVVAAICGVLVFASAAAAGDIGFRDGPGSARTFARTLNRHSDYNNVACRYVRPVVRCAGYGRWARSDTYLRVTITLHRTAPKVGYMMVCAPMMGVCRRDKITYKV